MRALIKKEFKLCLHPTCVLFLLFAAFVFIPNYPYEVMFFFSGLSVFFVCLTARENGDAAFTCSLPVGKRQAVYARILFCMVFQLALLISAGILTAVKEIAFPAELQINMAGSSANLSFLGYGALLMGLFNVIFFPLYYQNPAKVGVPFFIASLAEFVAIALLVALRFAVPVYADALCMPDPAHMGAKAAVFCAGLLLYAGASALAALLSARRFARVDL